jgi:hypothetical protein
LLDRSDDADAPNLVDDFLRERVNRSTQHLVTLLSLIHPAEPLKIALHGLHSDDPQLRGTALEYLESILPAEIRTRLWPLLDTAPEQGEPHEPRSLDAIMEDLMKSNHSVMIRLEELRKQTREGSAG